VNDIVLDIFAIPLLFLTEGTAIEHSLNTVT